MNLNLEVVDVNSKWLTKKAAILAKQNELIKKMYYVKCIYYQILFKRKNKRN